MSVSREIDFSGDHYYKINRIILSAIGLWPHRHITLRQIQVALSSFLLVSVTFPQVRLIVRLFISVFRLVEIIFEYTASAISVLNSPKICICRKFLNRVIQIFLKRV